MNKFIKITLTVITLLVCGFFLAPYVIFGTTTGQQLLLWLEDEQAATFYFKDDSKSHQTVYMKGVIYGNTLDDIQELFEQYPSIKTIVMENVPGSIDDEVNLLASKEIRKHGIATYIPADGVVASGGTDMFLAGIKRSIGEGAKLGVHSWADASKTAREYGKSEQVHQPYLKYYREMNIPEEFYWYTLDAAPAEDIHWMTPEEIKQYQVLTEAIDSQAMLANLEMLSADDMAGRGTGNNQEAQKLIVSTFKKLKLTPFFDDYKQPFLFVDDDDKKRLGSNIVGYIKGRLKPEQYLVIGAHYDHMGVVDGKVFNGADDNASGTAAMLALAEYFSTFPPLHSIIFIAYDAEELGLHGSKHFVEYSPIVLDKIKLKFNFDMIGRNINNEIFIVGTHQYPQFKPWLQQSAKNSLLKVSYGHDIPDDPSKDYWMESSDNAPYFAKNIPNITFSEEDHPDYHQATDDFSRIDQQYYQNVVKLILRSVKLIDSKLITSSN